MDVNHKNVLAAVPKTINALGRIDGLKKYAGRSAVVVIQNESTSEFAPIPIGGRL